MKAELTVVLFQEGTQWVAQSLERDFAAQGATIPEAIEALASLLRADSAIRKAKPVAKPVPRAPQYYFDMLPH